MKLAFALLLAHAAFGQGRGPNNPIPEALRPQAAAVTAARNALANVVYSDPPNPAAIPILAGAVREAELTYAQAAAKAGLAPSAAQPGFAGGRGGGRPSQASYLTQKQATVVTEMNAELQPLVQAATAARTALFSAPDGAKADALKDAEIRLANARAAAFAKIQATPQKLVPEQMASVGAVRGANGLGFTLPEPTDFNDHEGYVSLFDGRTLKGWDGNPKFWRVEDGAIVGESTPQNPSGNSYIAYRDVEAHDFTLKFEVKVEGSGGTGIQYRSKTGIPWLAPISPAVTANVGPVNLNWMMTGPQADFWPATPYWTGQFYSENTPMRIMAWRGQVVEGHGLGPKRLMGNIGNIDELNKLVKHNDWNQYTVMARGPVLIHLINGQLMALMVDDDPQSSNNWSGQIGIEIEATTKVSVRNIWLKKLN